MNDKLHIVELSDEEVENIDERLEAYDKEYIKYKLDGNISIGFKDGEDLIAGVDACITDFKILYVSTFYVNKEYRRHGIGKRLMDEVEKRAKELGANMIRLDTYNWQGKDFYNALGFKEVGSYESKEDGFSEHFFLKKLF